MPIEEQLLPHKDLARFYDKVTWLYSCRMFQKKPEKDRVALRAHDRFGISSWPQMFLFDPADDRELGAPPRDLKGFIAVFDEVLKAFEPADAVTRARLAAAAPASHERALELEAQAKIAEQKKIPVGTVTAARAAALDPKVDIVVRIRALRLVRMVDPKSLAPDVGRLLALDNDQWRYEVLGLAKDAPLAANSQPILGLIAGVGSKYRARNPNVVRIRAIETLGACGDGSAVESLAGFLRGPVANALTRITPRTLAEIGARHRDVVPEIRKVLEASRRVVPADRSTKGAALEARLAMAMNREIDAALERLRD